MKEKIKYIIKFILLFIVLLILKSLPIVIFNIDYDSYTMKEKMIYESIWNIIILIIFILSYYKTLKEDAKKFFSNFSNNFEEAFKVYLIGVIVMIVSNVIITLILGNKIAENEQLVRERIELFPILMLLDVAIYAPLTEELLFRKGIRDIINNKWLYIFVSGFIFGGLHVISSTGISALLYLVPYCSLGFAFAYLYTKTNNIFSSMSMHFLHNTVTILLYLIGANII